MKKLLFLGVVASSALMLAGCAGDLAGSAGAALKKSSSQAAATLNDAAADLPTLRRNEYLAKLNSARLIANEKDDATRENLTRQLFARLACQGVGGYAAERAGFDALTMLNETVATLTAPSSDDFGDLLDSIEKYRESMTPLTLKNSHDEKSLFTDCVAKTQDDLKMIFDTAAGASADPYTFAISSAVDAAKALLDILKNVAIAALKETDAAIREEALRNYLKSAETKKVVVRVLGSCADSADTAASDWEKKLDECLKGGSGNKTLLADAAFQEFLNERRRLSLIGPYFAFSALAKKFQGSTPDERAEAMGKVDSLHKQFALFDSVRLKQVPKDQHANMVKAYVDLRRIMEGNLTFAERRKQLKVLLARTTALFNTAKDSLTAADAEADKLRDLIREIARAG